MKKLLLLLSLSGLVNIIWAQDEGPVYLKTYLQQLETQLQNHLNDQEENRLVTSLKGTNYFYQAIDLFANQCKNGPFSKFDKLKKKELEAYQALKQMIDSYTAGNMDDEQVYSKLLAYFNEHDFKQQPPKPNLYQTAIGNTHHNSQFVWELSGDFDQLKGDSSAYVAVMGIMVYPAAQTDSTLKFIIPVAEFVYPDTVRTLTTIDAQLNLLYKVGKGKKPSDNRHIFYHYVMGVLPENPGSIRIEKTSSSEVEEVQHKRTRTFLLNGIKGDLVEKLCVPSHTGWTVVPGSIELVLESSTGSKNRDWNYNKTGSGAGTCYLIEVFKNTDGPSGKLEYHLKYDIAKTTQSNGLNVTTDTLKWDDTQVIPLEPNWKVTYIRPDGTIIPVTSGVYQWPGIELEMGTENFSITTQGILNP